MTQSIKGSCLCGKVTYMFSDHLGIFQYCHCSRCRKFTGSAHAANLFVKDGYFQWLSGEAEVVQYNPDFTKYFATAFCRHCGSALPWLSKGGKTRVIPAGTLDDDLEIQPQWNIFCASQAPWYQAASDLPHYDELPPRK